MSWGNPAIAAPVAVTEAVRCDAPSCNNYALLVVSIEGEEKNSCVGCIKSSATKPPILRAVEGAAFDVAARDMLLEAWEHSKVVLERAKETEMELRKASFAYTFVDAKEGTNRVDLGGGYSLKGVRKVNYKIAASNDQVDEAEDKAAKIGNEGTFLFERIITWTPNFSKSEYNKLEESNPTHVEVKKLIDGLIETTDGAPTLEIEAPKAKLN